MGNLFSKSLSGLLELEHGDRIDLNQRRQRLKIFLTSIEQKVSEGENHSEPKGRNRDERMTSGVTVRNQQDRELSESQTAIK